MKAPQLIYWMVELSKRKMSSMCSSSKHDALNFQVRLLINFLETVKININNNSNKSYFIIIIIIINENRARCR